MFGKRGRDVEVLAERQVARGTPRPARCAPTTGRRTRPRASPAASARSGAAERRSRRTRPAGRRSAATSKTWARSSVATTPPIIARMSSASRLYVRRVGFVISRRQNAQAIDTQDDHRDDVLHRRRPRPRAAPSSGIETIAWIRPAGDDVRGADRQQDEAPEDPGVHQPGAPVPEHLRLDERVLDQAREPRAGCRDGRGCAVGRARGREHPQVAGHREDEERGRAPEQREHQRVAGDVGEVLEHQRTPPAGDRRRRRRPPRRVVERAGQRLERVVEHRDDRLERLERALRAARAC